MKYKWLAQCDINNDWHSHILTQEWIFLSSILGCFKSEIDKVLVSRMTLKTRIAKPDKAMRNNQNLIAYHINILMSYKVLSDMKNVKNIGFCHIQRHLELDERIFKVLRAKEFKIQSGNIAAWVGSEELKNHLCFTLNLPLWTVNRLSRPHREFNGDWKKIKLKIKEKEGDGELEMS